jgi:hypothetical protein
MNTERLAKMYHTLTAQERLPLLLAAEKRGDKTEYQRLKKSAPPSWWQMPDYQHRLLGLNVLALSYVADQLENLANYWHASWRLTDNDDEKPADWLLIRDVSAYVFCRQEEAWRRFCQELNVDAEQLIAGNYAGCILGYCSAGMAEHAPSREALIGTQKASGIADPQPLTTETCLRSWRKAFGLLEAQAGGQ